MSVRVRYAPSPTGLQHIGGLRTALFNYLFAKALGGKFYLRIEDTDQTRYDPEAEKDLYDTLKWAGLSWDEGPDCGGEYGPYVQSERLGLYQKWAQELAIQNKAYPCYCTAHRLDELRRGQEAAKSPTGYDGHCSRLSPQEREAAHKLAQDEGRTPVIRFRLERQGTTTVKDLLLGDVVNPNADLMPDPVLLKSDGFPTYHLAHVVDDHLMKTTHVLRAREWLPSSPLHVQLFQAFGWEVPLYLHLPLILGQDGQKLSKRHGATSVRQFRESGYLPQALVNYLSLLGWSYDDSRELFSLSELENLFTLERINKAPAVFDYKKLEWFNGQYLRLLTPQELARETLPLLQSAGLIANPPPKAQMALLTALIPLVHERLHLLPDIVPQAAFAFKAPESWPLEDLIPKKQTPAYVASLLAALEDRIKGLAERTDEEQEQKFRDLAAELDVKLGDVMMPLRVAVCGSRISPPLIGSLRLLGEEESLKRIRLSSQYLQTHQGVTHES